MLYWNRFLAVQRRGSSYLNSASEFVSKTQFFGRVSYFAIFHTNTGFVKLLENPQKNLKTDKKQNIGLPKVSEYY